MRVDLGRKLSREEKNQFVAHLVQCVTARGFNFLMLNGIEKHWLGSLPSDGVAVLAQEVDRRRREATLLEAHSVDAKDDDEAPQAAPQAQAQAQAPGSTTMLSSETPAGEEFLKALRAYCAQPHVFEFHISRPPLGSDAFKANLCAAGKVHFKAAGEHATAAWEVKLAKGSTAERLSPDPALCRFPVDVTFVSERPPNAGLLPGLSTRQQKALQPSTSAEARHVLASQQMQALELAPDGSSLSMKEGKPWITPALRLAQSPQQVRELAEAILDEKLLLSQDQMQFLLDASPRPIEGKYRPQPLLSAAMRGDVDWSPEHFYALAAAIAAATNLDSPHKVHLIDSCSASSAYGLALTLYAIATDRKEAAKLGAVVAAVVEKTRSGDEARFVLKSFPLKSVLKALKALKSDEGNDWIRRILARVVPQGMVSMEEARALSEAFLPAPAAAGAAAAAGQAGEAGGGSETFEDDGEYQLLE